MEIKPNERLKLEIIGLVKNVTQANLGKIVQLFQKNELSVSDRKEILELAFKEKGSLLIGGLYNSINLKLDNEYKNYLVELAFNNTSSKPDIVFELVVTRLFPTEINKEKIKQLFSNYKERGIKLIESAILNDSKQLKDFFKKNLGNSEFNKLKKEVIIDLIKNAHSEDDVENILKVFNNSQLTIIDCKDILELAFKEKGFLLIDRLYNSINPKLDNEYKNYLVELAFNNTSRNPDKVFGFIKNKFPNNVDKTIKKLFSTYKKSGIKLIKSAIANKNSNLEKFFIEKVDVDNIIDNIIEYTDDVELFKKFFEIKKGGKDYSVIDHRIIISKIYSKSNGSKIFEFALKNLCNSKELMEYASIPSYFIKSKDVVFTSIFKALLSGGQDVNILLLNKILEKITEKGEALKLIKFENIYKNIRENLKEEQNDNVKNDKNAQEKPVEIQGENQTEILERNVKYKDSMVESVIDTVHTNLKDKEKNKRLYDVIYKNDSTQEIIYCNSKGNTLAKAIIDQNGIMNFEGENFDKKEIKEVLNDNYKSMEGFDHELSFLSYTLLDDRKDIIFKTNCKNIEDITDIITNNQNKMFICDLNTDKHNVQVLVNNENIVILNTGVDFEYIKNSMENIVKGLQNVKVKHIEMINQSCGNCVEASKLYTVVLAEKYKQHFGSLEKLSERLDRFEEFMENTINIKDKNKQIKYLKKEYDKGSTKEENIKMIKTILETNIELLEKHKKHFLRMSESIKSFYNVVAKIDPTLNNDTKKMYDITNIISLGNEINYLQSKKNNNGRYKKFTEDVVKFYKINLNKKEKDGSLTHKLDKGEELLEFIKMCIYYSNEQSNKQQPNERQLNEQQKRIFENINKKVDSGGENVFEECLEEFNKLKSSKIEF